MREKHEPVRNTHCNCSRSKHLQPAPQTLLRHSSPVLSLSQAVEDLYLNRPQSQIHQNSVPQTAHYLQQHHSTKSKKTATCAATSVHQKARAQGQGQAKVKAKESIYSVSTEQTATRAYATTTRYWPSQLLDHEQTAFPTQLLLVLGHGAVMARRDCWRDVQRIHRVRHVLLLLHSSGFGSGLSQRMDLQDRPCLPRRAEDVLPPQIQRGRNFI